MAEHTKPAMPVHRGHIALGIGALGFVLWATLVPLAQGVVLNGTLGFQGERKTITHPYGGVVKTIWVHEGQQVEKGQTLISLDRTEAQAQWNSLNVQRQALLAKQQRLLKETRSTSPLAQTGQGQQQATTPFEQAQESAESLLYKQRQQALRDQINTLQVDNSTAQRNRLAVQQAIQTKQGLLTQLQKQAQAYADLVAKGYMASNRLLDVQTQINTLQVGLAQDAVQENQLTGQIQTAQLKMNLLNNQQRADSQLQVTEVQAQVANLDEQLDKLAYVLKHADIVSPTAGQVLALQLFTTGSAMPANTPLMHIAPQSASLELSAQLPPHLADQVRLGLPVTVRFSGLKTVKTLELTGTVDSIGADQLSDPATRMAFIPVKVRLDAGAQQTLAEHHVQAGVPAEMLIVSGEHTLLQYLLKPLKDRMFPALREP